jgi:UDPglucose 6-dehydrogenase
MDIAVVGAGYVGLVSATCFADFGHSVVCVDTDAAKIDNLKIGTIPIYEPGLDDLVKKNVAQDRLHFTTQLKEAVKGATVIFVAVGTPSRRGDGHADLSYVYQAARDIASSINPRSVVVLKSTVPVGTGDEVESIIRAARPGLQFSVVSNPEFLREGAAIGDFKRPDRIVVGTEDEHGREVMSEVYRPLFLNQSPLFFTERRTSELIKYASNAFLAVKITFINEIADLCELADANIQDVARGMGLDNRIGQKFLHAGPGYGGSCFPKDTAALVKTAQDYGAALRIVETAAAVNDQRKRTMARKVISACGGSVRGKTVGVLGLTFKPNTDDMRDAPSISVIQALLDAGANVRVTDPIGIPQAEKVLSDVTFTHDAYSCAEKCSALVLVTEWDAYRALDFLRLRSVMHIPVVVDLRNVYRAPEVERHGFIYSSVGHRPSQPKAVLRSIGTA